MKIRFSILNPEDLNLANDYIFGSNSWGDFFYKFYESPQNYAAALTQCESDGAFLAYPRSQAENDFLLSIVGDTDAWIGINDVDEEGTIVTSDGQDIVFTKWYNPLPSNHNNKDGAMIYAANWGSQRESWVLRDATELKAFVCWSPIVTPFTNAAHKYHSQMLGNANVDQPIDAIEDATVQPIVEETTVTTLEPPVEETTVTTLAPDSALQNAQPTYPPEFLARDDNINEGKLWNIILSIMV